MKAAAAVAILVCLASCATLNAAPPPPAGTTAQIATLGPVVNGTASNYGGPQDQQNPFIASGGLVNGACGYGRLQSDQWPFWAAAGISVNNTLARGATPLTQSSMPMNGCGICIQIVCNDPVNCPPRTTPVTVQVTDSCDTCTPTQINVHYLAFDHFIASGALGNVSVQYQQVECHPPGPIRVHIVDYRPSQGGFLALTLQNVAGAAGIQSVEMRTSPTANVTAAVIGNGTLGEWLPLRNSYGAVWQRSGLPPLPWDLRITSAVRPEQLVARQAITNPQPGSTTDTSVQFSISTSPAFLGQPGSMLRPAPASNASLGNAQPAGRSTTPSVQPTPGCTPTVYDLLRSNANATTFLRLADRAGLTQALMDPNATFTVLVPTNQAFASVLPNVFNASSLEDLQLVLLYHFLPGALRSIDVGSTTTFGSPILPEDLVNGRPSIPADTINGLRLRVVSVAPGRLLFVGHRSQANTVRSDLFTCNSVVHLIDNVLLP